LPNQLTGACPSCGTHLTIEVAVFNAPPGFANTKSVRLEEPGVPSAVNSQDGRPTCPSCSLDCRRVEAAAKKAPNTGRRFTGWKCCNNECDNNDKGWVEFRWLDAAA